MRRSKIACQQAPTPGSRIALFIIAALLAATGAAAATSDPPSVFVPVVAPLASPARPGAVGPSLATGPDGTVYLSWVEPAEAGTRALKFATLDARAHRWSAARTIAQGRDWQAGGADFPQLAVQKDGHLTAVWLVLNEPEPPAAGHDGALHHHEDPLCHALYSRSADGGATWSPPQALTRESDTVEFVALQPLADGTLLAAWLDGRGKKSDSKNPQQLWSRVVGSDAPDLLVDPSVCDCCQLALTGFPDGSALLAYRGRTVDEIRDIRVTRLEDGRWEKPDPLGREHWKIAGCPVNGPRVASAGPRVTATWFTAADNEPRVLLTNSPDAGGIYTMSQRVDLGHPLGHVDIILLHDGAQLVSWVEGAGDDASQPGGLYLRRYASFGATQPPALLAASSAVRGGSFPRLALMKDFIDRSPAQLIVAFTRAGEPSQVATLLVTLPDPAILAAADSTCDCAPHGEELVGYPVRGHVIAGSAETGVLRVRHGAVPGVMRAGEREFKAAPGVPATVPPGRDVLARIEQRDGAWWIFDVRLLAPLKQ